MRKNKSFFKKLSLSSATLLFLVSVLSYVFVVVPKEVSAATPVGTCSASASYNLQWFQGPLEEPYEGYWERYPNSPRVKPFYNLSASFDSVNGFCDLSSFKNFKMVSTAYYDSYLGDSGEYVREEDGSIVENPVPCPEWAESPWCSYFNEVRNGLINYNVNDDNDHSAYLELNNFSNGVAGYLIDNQGSKNIFQPTFRGRYDLSVYTQYSFDYLCNGEWLHAQVPSGAGPGFRIGFPIIGQNTAVYGDGSLDNRYYNHVIPRENGVTTWNGCPSKPMTVNIGTNIIPPLDGSRTKITANCSASPINGMVPLGVTWTASNVDGGSGPYIYTWRDSEGNTWTGQTKLQNYTIAGTKTATLTVTGAVGLPSDPINCDTTLNAPAVQSLAGSCVKITSTNTPAIGSPVTWQASGIVGGVTPYTYSWSGTDQTTPVTGSPYVKTYTTVGVKTPTLRVTSSDGQIINPVCPSVTVSPSLRVVVVGAGTINSVADFRTASETADGNIAGCTDAGGSACNHQYGPNAAVGLRATIPPSNTLTWSGCDSTPDGAGGSSCSVAMTGDRTVTATFNVVGAIGVTLSCPASVTYGSGPALSWNTSGNPDSCTASGAWTGSKTKNPTNGPETQAAITTDRTYTITCAKAGTASVVDSCTVKVGPSQPVILVSTPLICGGKIAVSITTPSQGFTSYTLNRLTGSTWATVGTNMTAADFSSYVKRLSPGATYRYELVAVGPSGLNAYSDYSLPTSAATASDRCAVNLLAI